jgi:lysophospholipase L1-like esterase
MSPKTKKKIGYWLFLFFFTLIAAEIILRIYNPFPSSVVGDKIILTPNYSKTYKNTAIPGDMDETIIYKRNSIGLRGPEPPQPFKDYLTIVAIGGSTTECMYISEGKTWEDQLGKNLSKDFPSTWINNAGFSGHSTFGHIILIRDYISTLKPSICIFLVGANDFDRKDLGQGDQQFTKTKEQWIILLAKKSALVNTLLNLYRNHLAREKSLSNVKSFSTMNKEPLYIPDSVIQNKLLLQQPLLEAYASRLKELIRLCRENKIEPIFLTQPTSVSDSTDSLIGINLSTLPLTSEMNGKLYERYLDLYNAETIKVAQQEGLFFIDLANELPKSSKYYYDHLHYNISGSNKVAEIISAKLEPYLQKKYPEFFSRQ